MSTPITKPIGEGHGRGELYAALNYNPTDVFGGYKIGRIFCEKIATSTDPDRLIQGSYTSSTTIAAGKQLQGMQIQAKWAGTSDCATAGITGAEFKAKADSNSITATLGTAKGIVVNVDVKKATFTTAYGIEAQFDIEAGGTITTGVGVRSSLNNSGTLTAGYAFSAEGITGNEWPYALKIAECSKGIYFADTDAIKTSGTVNTAAKWLTCHIVDTDYYIPLSTFAT